MKNFKKKFDFWALNNFRFSFDKREPISENEPSKCILLQTLIKIGYFQKGSFVFENSAKVDKKKKKLKTQKSILFAIFTLKMFLMAYLGSPQTPFTFTR